MTDNATHRALVARPEALPVLERVHTPTPGPDDVLLKLLSLGLCGTDLQMLRGSRPLDVQVLGHEGVARIARVGANVRQLAPGQTVVVNPVNPADQESIVGHTTPGLFQECFLVPGTQVEAGLLVPYDERIPLLLGPLCEPLATVVYGQSLVGQVCPMERIVIVGTGPIGLLHAHYAKLCGCPHVLLVHNSRSRAAWLCAQQLARPEELLANAPHLAREVLDRTHGEGVDAAFLCTPRYAALDALQSAVAYVRDQGCLDLVVGFGDEDRVASLPDASLNGIRRANICGIPAGGFVSQQRTVGGKRVFLTGHRGTSLEHFTRAMEILAQHGSHFSRIVSHVIPFSDAPAILERILCRQTAGPRGEFGKVVFDCIDGSG